MAYKYSDLDRKNLGWFPKDPTRSTLLSIDLLVGNIRGLRECRIDFHYPITAIAGRNGSGKTTVLALAACAFHNSPRGFRLTGRKHSYYTFSDFFIQISDEVPVSGVFVRYQILYNKWRPSRNNPEGIGPGWQIRRKYAGGRWNNYDERVPRTAVYLGIDRIVPHAERSVLKSYRGLLQPVTSRGWEADVQAIVGRILGLDYSGFTHKQHSKYRLPVVTTSKGTTYSGFNMGAGEDSLFEFFSITSECPDGSLILIDEIELGLHEEAQSRLIKELKVLCEKRKFQIVCTTHSPQILESLPPEGRVFLERLGNKSHVIPGISSAYATGKLGGRANVELDILVEDEAAQLIVETGLTQELRMRVRVIPIGSTVAVMRHLAARFKERRQPEICALLDGDKASQRHEQINEFLKAYERSKDHSSAEEWVGPRLEFLPGGTWPEAWVINQRSEQTYERLIRECHISRERVDEILNAARRADKHSEFFEAARLMNLDQKILAYQLIMCAFETAPGELQKITDFISGFLRDSP